MAASSIPHRWKYDVFVSFRGEDIRKNFMDHLFKDFMQKGIHVFRYDYKLPRGEEISPQLFKAIEESRILIVIFSKGYAYSSQCLMELAKILECKQMQNPKHEVRTIFYDVKPDVVRKQKRSYAEAFAKHEILYSSKVVEWKKALSMAADLSGWDLQDLTNGYESKFIDRITKEVLIITRYAPLPVNENIIGVDVRVNKLNLWQFIGSSEVHMIGISGVSGIGKTTLAKAIYNSMYIHFDGSCFCDNIQGVSKRKGLTHFQKQLIADITKTKSVEISNVSEGIATIERIMSFKPILLVLDDVDHRDQLEALAGSPNWFSPGSLIIFTGKDEQLLRSHRVDEIHDMDFLDDYESLELFSAYAFQEKHTASGFEELAEKFVKYVQGHPLALKVLGGFLYGKTVGEWVIELDRLKVYSNEEIQRVLRISYDGLNVQQQNILLDIACSFVGVNLDFAASVLDSYNFFADTNMRVLVDKSLITISSDMSLQMHDLIEAMAREIVREESTMLGKQSRLWISSEIYDVLSGNKVTVTEAVEVVDLMLEKSCQHVHINAKAFAQMKNLRILKIYHEKDFEQEFELEDFNVKFSGSLKFLSNELRLLHWNGFPFRFLPSSFYPEKIVAIDLSYSNIKRLWTTRKCFIRLKVMKLRHCRMLTSTPDFTEITNLEELILEGCVNLTKLHPSVGMLKRLVVLNMGNCKSLKSFPCKVETESLKVLSLSGCLKVDKLPEGLGRIKTLVELHIDRTAITELPSSVYSLRNLESLSCGQYERIPSRWSSSFSRLLHLPSRQQVPQSLKLSSLAVFNLLMNLNLSHCNISEVTDSIGGLAHLKYLYLRGNIFTSLPGSLSQLSLLNHLDLDGCRNLEVVPVLPPSTKYLYAGDCTSLRGLPERFNPGHIFCSSTSLGFPKPFENTLIGMDSHVDALNSLLNIEAMEEVRIVEICGVGGIGKTTIAQAMFDTIAYKFEGSSFVEGVRVNSSSIRDICALQEHILRDVLVTPHGFTILDPMYGVEMIRARCCTKKVLVVLDDVGDIKQLEFLAAERKWFGPGSRIIITTRDELLSKDVDASYTPGPLREDQAVELFSRFAFRKTSPPEGYEELSYRVVSYSGYLPLALKVLGSCFHGREAIVWESALNELAKGPNEDIRYTLQLSYDVLDSNEKNIFLDIACFFKDKDKECVTRVLDSFGFSAAIGIKVLTERSLITVSNNRLNMHDLIQEMGRNVVNKSSPHSRLWQLEEIYNFIKENRELETVEAIVVPNKQYNVQQMLGFRADVFESMNNLRLIDVFRKFTSCEPTIIPCELRWLCWNQYPFSSLPLVDGCKLVGLEMQSGNIEHLWMGQKILKNLTFIHLQRLECLTRFPDVSEAPNIERLVLSYCRNLVEVHESLGSHDRLVYVDMSDCWKLKRFPSKIEMKSLETLILTRCSSLERFPEVMPCMVRLSNIYLDGCSSIEELPSSVRYLYNLSFLNLTKCTSIRNIPNSICELKNLKSLFLHDCVEVLNLPSEIGRMEKLQELQLGFTDSRTALQRQPQSINFHTLTNLCSLRKLDMSWRRTGGRDFPENLHAFSSLKELNLSGNSELTELPASINHLCHLKLLELNECYRLQSLHSLPSGIQVLRASGCSSLEMIEDHPEKYKWLYKIWLVGCWKLPDQEDEINPSKMLQISFLRKCAAVGHRLSIAIPGCKIPSWFNEEQHGCDTTLELPAGCRSKILGLAISGVFDKMWKIKHDYPVIMFTFIHNREFGPDIEVDYIIDGSALADIDTVWIGYIPFSFFHQICDDWSCMEGKLAIHVRLKTGQLPVRCGAQIVYKKDVESIQQSKTTVSDYCNSECLTRKGNSFIYEDEFRST